MSRISARSTEPENQDAQGALNGQSDAMRRSTEISVVFPVYNELGNINDLYNESREVLETNFDRWEMIFVDDGSTDGSSERLIELHQRDERVKVLKFAANFGQSAALDAGLKRARGETVVTMDSDGQNDPSDIPKLVAKLDEGYDCVVGWRRDREDSFGKTIASRIAMVMRRAFLNTELHDYGCTLKAFRANAAKELEIRGEMHRYIPPLLKWRGYSVSEVEVNHRKRTEGETKYGWQRIPKGFIDMVNVWFWQKYSRRPLHIFGGLGILAGFFGFLLGGYAAYLKVVEGVSLSDTALPLFAVFMTLLGIQLFVSGFLADISIRNYFQLKRSNGYRIESVFE